ncbi:MAG TPA: hypothetical protein VH640_27970 [Bryobacteraceae bacterium]|jgi:hypothetical protein
MTRKTRDEIGELTPQQIEELNELSARPDSEIDFSDIPEIAAIPRDAIRGKDWKHYRGKTIILTDEIHAYFCAIADRRGISINEVVNDILAKEIAFIEAVK